MIDANTVLRRRSDTRFRLLGSEGIVIQQTAGDVIALNPVAARAVELVDGERSAGDIVDHVQQEFDASRDQIEQDVLGFLGMLSEQDVLERVE